MVRLCVSPSRSKPQWLQKTHSRKHKQGKLQVWKHTEPSACTHAGSCHSPKHAHRGVPWGSGQHGQSKVKTHTQPHVGQHPHAWWLHWKHPSDGGADVWRLALTQDARTNGCEQKCTHGSRHIRTFTQLHTQPCSDQTPPSPAVWGTLTEYFRMRLKHVALLCKSVYDNKMEPYFSSHCVNTGTSWKLLLNFLTDSVLHQLLNNEFSLYDILSATFMSPLLQFSLQTTWFVNT